jgi:hypothetical protein
MLSGGKYFCSGFPFPLDMIFDLPEQMRLRGCDTIKYSSDIIRRCRDSRELLVHIFQVLLEVSIDIVD